jgi:hypothetical protein
MRIKVSHKNVTGEALDERIVSHSSEDRAAMLARDAAEDLLEISGGLYPGDSITAEAVS